MKNSLDLHSADYPMYRPGDSESEYLRQILNRFESAKTQREQDYRILNNRSLDEYWKDSEQRWLSYIPERRRKEWQSRVVKPVTRNRCIAIIANLLSSHIDVEFLAQRDGISDEKVTTAISALYDLSQERDKYMRKQLATLIDAVSMGTAFLQEDYAVDKRKVKDIVSWDPTTNKMETKDKTILDFEGFRSGVLSPYEVYLGNVWIGDIQEQPYLFVRKRMDYMIAKKQYGKFSNWKNVQPGSHSLRTDESAEQQYFAEAQVHEDLENDDVEVLVYQSRPDDEMAVIINGVLLTAPHAPMPYTHKKYNLVKVTFEPLSNRFAYGKSLPDKIQAEQDVIDTLYRMMIDKTYLSIFPPMLARGMDKIDANIVAPGKITPTDTEADLIVPKGLAGGVGNETNMLQLVENSMSESTIHPQLMGVPAGGERSATQVLETRRAAQRIMGLFGFMMMFMVEDQADLRVKNILQFWAKTDRKVLKDGEEEAIKNIFDTGESVLPDGTTGSLRIEFLTQDLQPTRRELRQQKAGLSKNGKNVRILVLDPDAIRNYDIHTKVVGNPTERDSKELQKAMSLEFYDRFINNPTVSVENLTRETMRDLDRDPDKMMNEGSDQTSKLMQGQAEQAMVENQAGGARPETQREGNMASQISGSQAPDIQQVTNPQV